MSDDELRYCRCADPENCRETVPGYVCRKGSAPVRARATADEIAAWEVAVQDYADRHGVAGALMLIKAGSELVAQLRAQAQQIADLRDEKNGLEKFVIAHEDTIAEMHAQLEGIKAALFDESLTPFARVVAASTYVGGLVEPTAKDIEWAQGELKDEEAP
jgi:hypothetical protein